MMELTELLQFIGPLMEYFESGGSMLQLVVLLVIFFLLKGDKKKTAEFLTNLVKHHNYDAVMESDKQMQLQLKEINTELVADRSFIVEFHNGDSNIGRIPMMKMSMRGFDITAPGTRSIRHEMTGLPISFFHDWVDIGRAGRVVAIPDIEETSEPYFEESDPDITVIHGLKEMSPDKHRFIQQNGSRAVYMWPLFTKNKQMFGVGVVSFSEAMKLDKNQINSACMRVYLIADGLLKAAE